MKKMILIFGLLMFTMAIYAQDELTSKAKITQVMRSEEDYLYADQTCGTVEQALERAQNILLREIEAYLKESGENGEVVKGAVTEQMVTVTVQRGNKYRAFVYVNKAELGLEKPTPATKGTHAPHPTDTNTPHIDDPTPMETDSVHTTENAVIQNESNSILGKIAAMTSRLQVYDYICLLNKDGVNISFFEHLDSQGQAKMYLILYRRGGKIEAILTPPDGQGIRHNLVSGEPDTLSNHPATSMNGFLYEP